MIHGLSRFASATLACPPIRPNSTSLRLCHGIRVPELAANVAEAAARVTRPEGRRGRRHNGTSPRPAGGRNARFVHDLFRRPAAPRPEFLQPCGCIDGENSGPPGETRPPARRSFPPPAGRRESFILNTVDLVVSRRSFSVETA